MDDKLIIAAKKIQIVAEKEAEKRGKAYIGSLPKCEIMVAVFNCEKNVRHVCYYLNGKKTHKKRVLKLIVKLLQLKQKKLH
jgi:BioD-like phosphotransacetylase family protein